MSVMLLKLCLAAFIAIGIRAEHVKCNERGSQYAVKGCSESYYQCHNGDLSQMHCPPNLFFDINTLACEYKDRVEACVLGDDGLLEYGSDDLPSCETKEDGELLELQLKCTNKFAQCNHGSAVLKTCPWQQFYNSATQRCDYKQNVENCKPLSRTNKNKKISSKKFMIPKQNSPSAQKNRQISRSYTADEDQNDVSNGYGGPAASPSLSANSAYGPVQNDEPAASEPEVLIPAELPTAVEPVPNVPEKKKFDCSARDDGEYKDEEEECSKFFWNCVHGQAFKYTCPSGLFYDLEIKQCVYRYDNPSCGGQRPVKTTEVAPARDEPKIDFDCSGKEAGYYALNECSNEFVHCISGIATLMRCASATVFDVRSSACVYAEECNAPAAVPEVDLDHGSLPTYQAPVKAADPAVAPAPQVAPSVPPSPQAPTIQFDCNNKENGIYGIDKCKKQYAACTNGVASIMACHGDLVYNQGNGLCDYRDSCLNPPKILPPTAASVPATVAPAQAVPQALNPYTSPNQTPSLSPVQPPAPAPVAKGAYTINGYTLVEIPAQAPPAYPASAPAAQAPSSYYGEQPPVAQNPQPPAPQPPVVRPPLPSVPTPAPVSCSNLKNGAHPIDKCARNYVTCWNQESFPAQCPKGLVFNSKTQACDYKSNVEDCPEYVVPQTTPAPAANPPAPQPPVNFDCSGKEDGIYGLEGCTQEFVQCVNGIPSLSKCAAALHYNVDNGMCDYKSAIVVCGGSKPTAPPAVPTAAPTQPPILPPVNGPYGPAAPAPTPPAASPPAASPVPAVPAPAPAPPTFSCIKKNDGYYSNGCSSTYYACNGQATYQFICPASLKFAQEAQHCDLAEAVPECGGKLAVPAPQPEAPIAASPPQDNSACLGKADGFYGVEACSAKYIACVGGIISDGLCNGDLFFNEPQNSCDYKENVAGCRPAEEVVQPPVESQGPYGGSNAQSPAMPATAAPRPVHRPHKKRTFKCNGLTDGYYATGVCKTTYVYCQSGNSVMEANCPAQLIYNSNSQQCDYRESTPECQPKTAAPAPTTPVPQRSEAVVQPAPQVSHVERNAFCENKRDGLYAADRCSHKYFVCSSMVTYPFHCTSPTVFDEVQSKCVFKEELELCGVRPSVAVEQILPQVQQLPQTQPPQAPHPQPASQYGAYQQPQPASQYGAYQQPQPQFTPVHQAPSAYGEAQQMQPQFAPQQLQYYQQFPQAPAVQQPYTDYGYGK